MAIAEMFLWWYSRGWSVFVKKIKIAIGNVTDFFSMGDLVRTLFQPFRQISAGSARADSSLDLKFHMFLDRLVSRFIGFSTRLILLIAGLLIIIVGGIVGLFLVIIWPLIPLAPIIGIVLAISGVAP